jgi:hypothetical protein
MRINEILKESNDNEDLANEIYSEFERIYPNLARRADERTVHAAIMDVLNYGGDNYPTALAQDVARAVKQSLQDDEQSVEEGTHRSDGNEGRPDKQNYPVMRKGK